MGVEGMAIRLQDIAEKAGVSFQTVSSVVNRSRGTVNVSEKTRNRIIQIANELGYVPNSAARALVKGKSHMIGIMCHDLNDPHLYRGISQIEKLCTEAGFSVKLSTTQFHPDWLSQLQKKEVDLLISLGVYTFREARLDVPEALRSQIVMVGPRQLPRDYIENPRQWGLEASWDDVAMGRMAVEHFFSLGHRKIAVFAGNKPYGYRPRALGAIKAIEAAGETPIIISCDEENDMTVAGRVMTEKYLANGGGATAIFMRSDLFYPGVIATLGQNGLRVPEDISLIGCMGFYREVTNIDSPIIEGVNAILEGYLKNGRLPEHDINLNPILIAGKTCAAPSKK
jgi:LacI family transcriptional regulator